MMSQLLGDVATATLTIAAVVVLLGQCRKPKCLLGRLILWTNDVRHSSVTDWELEQLPLDKNPTMLDVGCGG
jgi:hypothetical protein